MGTSFRSTPSWPLHWPQIPFFKAVLFLEICCTSSPSALTRTLRMYPSLTSLVSLLWEQLWDFGLFVPRRMESPSANPFNFSAVTSFVCVREVEPWQDHKKSLLYSPREVGVLRAHTAQSRGPLKCHRVYKGSFSTLKKKITTGHRILLLLISDKKTRDQRPQGSYPKPHSSDPDSSAHPLVDVVDARLGASPGPILVPILNPQEKSRGLMGPVSCLPWLTRPS